MTTTYGSLLALDSFASEESLRIAAYGRALKLSKAVRTAPSVELVAARFIDFVSDERWRLDALDVALSTIDRGADLDRLMKIAEEIADWAKPASASAPASEPVKKKSTRRK